MGLFQQLASKQNQALGQLALTGVLLEGYRRSEQGAYDTTMVTLGVTGVWLPWARRAGFAGIGWGLRLAILTAPGAAITAPVAVGTVVSHAIDPEEGLPNYFGFLSGGRLGNDPNYWDSDPNNSGYFNVHQNFVNILRAKREAKSAAAQKRAEEEYIRNYEMNQYLERLSQDWLALSPEERAAMSDFTTQ